MRHLFKPSVLFCLSGFSFAVASLYPETWLSLGLALLMGILFSAALESEGRIYRGAFLAGICFYITAFYWVPQTVQVFGGFSTFGSFAVFLLFVLTASVQFVIVAWLYSKLRSRVGLQIGIVLPLAWIMVEAVFPRLFPWQIGHVLIVFSPIAACAEFVGVTPLSGLLLWFSASCYRFLSTRAGVLRTFGPVCLTIVIVLVAGMQRNRSLAEELKTSPSIKVALIQGNLSTEQKGDVTYLQANVERYRELTQKAVVAGAQIVFWPESVLNQWLPKEISNVRASKFDPSPSVHVPLVYGTLSFESRTPAELTELQKVYSDYPELLAELRYKKYNAAVGINKHGDIVGRYYKRILMPFGEFLPFADIFPVIRSISPHTGDFSPGTLDKPFVFSVGNESPTELRIGVLICYEDLIPSLSSDAVVKDANLLVNLTNDAWYGDTAAPNQHHLLAQWRAIEARRFFLRVTNTGRTAIVNPYGRTQSSLPAFVESSLVDSVSLLEAKTFYSRWAELPLVVLVLFGLVTSCWLKRRERNRE